MKRNTTIQGFPIEPTLGLESAYRPEIVIEGTPRQVMWEQVRLVSNVVTAGLWEGRPGTIRITNYAVHEFLCILSGWLELTDGDGTTHRIGPGMSAYIPKGWSGTFRIGETTRKMYVLANGGDSAAEPPEPRLRAGNRAHL